MDEKSMILEQERLEKAKKRKKYKKLKWIAGGLAGVLLIGGAWYVVKGRSLMMTSQATMVEIEATADQTIVYANILSIYGNEITYMVTEEPMAMQVDMAVVEENSSGRGESAESGGSRGNFGGMGQMPEGFDPENFNMEDFNPENFAGEMPQRGGFGGGDFSGEMPRGGFDSGMPSGGFGDGRPQQGGGRGGDSVSGGDRPMPGNNGMPGQIREETDKETFTTYIPVGTDVITKLGTVTTFSRLAAGDTVALVTELVGEEQIIMSVYIVD